MTSVMLWARDEVDIDAGSTPAELGRPPAIVEKVIETRQPILQTARLVLTPLKVADAVPMHEVLADPLLYAYMGRVAPTLPELQHRYRLQCRGPTASDHAWYNWIIRRRDVPVAFVQATVGDEGIADHIHRYHEASQRVATAMGLVPTGVLSSGDVLWQRRDRCAAGVPT